MAQSNWSGPIYSEGGFYHGKDDNDPNRRWVAPATTDVSGAITGLVRPDGGVQATVAGSSAPVLDAAVAAGFGPNSIALVSTFANLPAPAAYIGNALVTDVGPSGSLWRSNGVSWGVVGGSVVLGQSHVAIPSAADTTLQTLASIVLPPNIMGPNGALRFSGKWTFTNNANTKTVHVTNAGVAWAVSGSGYASGTSSAFFRVVVENRNATNAQLGNNGSGTMGSQAAAWGTGAIDTTAAMTVGIGVQKAVAGDTATLESWRIELLRP